MEKNFHYVYITTNLINGHRYVGDRSCNCEPKEDKYLGSGTYYSRAENLHGKQNFKKEILELFPTKQDAFNAQEKYIIQFNTLIPNGYNISPKGGYGVPDSYLHEETKTKIGKQLKGRIYPIEEKQTWKKKVYSKEAKENFSKMRKGIKYPNRKKPKPFTKEHKKNISKGSIGKTKKPWTEERKKNSSILKTGKPHKPMSEEGKKNIRDAWAKRK